MEQWLTIDGWKQAAGELTARLDTLWPQAIEIWLAGGWAMGAIAVTSIVMFGLGVHIHLNLRAKRFQSLKESRWRRWIDEPELRRGPIGELLDFAVGAPTLKENSLRFEELHATETKPFVRDLRVMRISISAAVLLGLLGTVTGMLDTFGAMSDGTGGEKTMDLIAKGVSQALVTTETGLVIALAGLFFQYQLAQKHERYKAFLAHLETVCAQKVHEHAATLGARHSDHGRHLATRMSAARPADGNGRGNGRSMPAGVEGENDSQPITGTDVLPAHPLHQRRSLTSTDLLTDLLEPRSIPTHESSEPPSTWDDSATPARKTAARRASTSRR